MTASFEARKAIESLRAGVPNLYAVAALGVRDSEIIQAFDRSCEVLVEQPDAPAAKSGFFIEGNFGSGKSHTLRHLQALSAQRSIASSSLAVSKETPLGDLSAIYRSAIAGLRFGDGRLGGTLSTVFERLLRNKAAFSSLCATARDPSQSFDALFLASLLLLRRYCADAELVDQLYDFWDGGPPQLSVWKRLLRDVDEDKPPIRSVPVAELAEHRFRFAATVLRAAGYKGWFVALDEVELIASFSLRARAKAYATLAFLFGAPHEGKATGRWFAVAAVTEDLAPMLFKKRDDIGNIKDRFRFEPDFVARALTGAVTLLDDARRIRLAEPTDATLLSAHDAIRELYSRAYSYPASQAFRPGDVRPKSKSMRSYVRGVDCILGHQDAR